MQKAIKRYFPVFVLPTLIAFTIGFLAPFVLGVYLSFCKFTTVTDARFIGLGNYAKILGDGDFLHSLWFTALFTIVTVLLINIFAFAVAMLLTKSIKGTNIFRTVFFMPNLIGGIVLGYVWQLLLNGILAHFQKNAYIFFEIRFLGISYPDALAAGWIHDDHLYLRYPEYSWRLIEAAQIDGANKVQLLRYVTIPMVMPSITICTFLTLTNGFKLFDQNLALTNGGPDKMSEMLALNIYNTFYGRTGWEGVGQAKAVVFFIIVGVIALIQNKMTTSKEVQQ